MVKEFDLEKPLPELLDAARNAFGKVEFEPIKLGDTTLEILQIADMPAYLEKLVGRARPGAHVELPLWAKVWPSASILTMFAMRMDFAPGMSVLEIGAGTGLAGLALAARGCDVTLTDIDPGALLFCRINALHNGLGEKVRVRHADFTKDDLGETYQRIVACEVLYRESLLSPLVDFLLRHLQTGPGAEVLLASDAKREGRLFFDLAKERFRMMKKDVPYRDSETGEEKSTCLYRLAPMPGQGAEEGAC